jgi:hypothetical protein
MRVLGAAAQLTPAENKESLVFVTQDGKRIVAKRSVFLASPLVREVLAETSPDSDEPVVIPLDTVDSTELFAIHEYQEHHHSSGVNAREIERPLRTELKMCVDSWDWKYVEDTLLRGADRSDLRFVFSVLKGASFLGLGELRDLCCASIAEVLRLKTEEEILDIFECPGGFTAEDEAALIRDFPWLSD